MTSALESRRHPELVAADHGLVAGRRRFLSWALTDALDTGELSSKPTLPRLWRCCWQRCWGWHCRPAISISTWVPATSRTRSDSCCPLSRGDPRR
ncbi:hypothetical protein MAP_0094 [Mycobacterium avium subsp. paratuberculosis K-10]|uniref:Uncharacterized protein n=1 Tax=Mycolicibacterium paratuberculosis (strain ATCC BAA-968 / K-10) TaxID=262316 RepID=Q744Z5_MYCPA|nr:hypothetical protein MAP_0094 [Mycobacterium avium subsp. paratuberculosis K-10]AGL38628.1 hypothetical protein MAP4_3781 [Mycobacterium avium subsp. paratuberculosis MAP4]